MSAPSSKNYDGMTRGLDGRAISKNDASIHLEGAVDELNSHLGLVRAMLSDEDAGRFMEEIQKTLVRLMAHVSDCGDDRYIFSDDDVNILRKEADCLSENIPQRFQLPGRNPIEAQIQVTRTVARRAERHFVAAAENRPLCPNAGEYLNVLSNYLFALSHRY